MRVFKLAASVLVIASACGACFKRGPLSPEPRTTDANAKLVHHAYQVTLRETWEASGFYRSGVDAVLDLPVFVALADDGTACILSNAQWAAWREVGQVIVCRDRWRARR